MKEKQVVIHQSSKTLVQIDAIENDWVIGVVFPQGPPRRMTKATFDRDYRSVHPEGFRVREYTKPGEIKNALTVANPALLKWIIWDEIALGKPGLRKQTVAGYLENWTQPGEDTKGGQSTWSQLLDESPLFDKIEDSSQVFYIEHSGVGFSQQRRSERLERIKLWAKRSAVLQSEPTDVLEQRVAALLLIVESTGEVDPKSLKDAAEILARVFVWGEGIFSAERRGQCLKALSAIQKRPAGWRLLSGCLPEAQIEIVKTLQSSEALALAVWDPFIKPTARGVAIALFWQEQGTERQLFRVKLKEEVLAVGSSQLAQAVDQAVKVALEPHRIAPIGLYRLSRLPDFSWVGEVGLPSLQALLGSAPVPNLLGWTQTILLQRLHLNVNGLKRTLAAMSGESRHSDWGEVLDILGVGAHLMGSGSKRFREFRKLCSDERLKSLLKAYYSTESTVEVNEARLRLVYSLDTAAKERGEVAADVFEKYRVDWDWSGIRVVFLSVIETLAVAAQERAEFEKKAGDPEHARLILDLEKVEQNSGVEAAIRHAIQTEFDRRSTADEKRYASVLAQIMTATQSARRRLNESDAIAATEKLELQIQALLKRLGWAFIGRIGEDIAPTTQGIEIVGDGNRPVVQSVGILDRKTERVILKAIVVRKAN